MPSAIDGRGQADRERAARNLEGLSRLPHDRRRRALAFEAVRRREFRVHRQGAAGHAAASRALEARRDADRQRHGRGGRAALCRAPLHPRSQGQGRRAGQESDRGDGQASCRARMDGARDQGEGARQAGRVHAEDRLSGQVARLFDAADRRRRRARQRDARQRSSNISATSTRSASPSTAANGACRRRP